jgi:hypothetical protein
VIDNTAVTHYWTRDFRKPKGATPADPLCSQCDPEIKKWHGLFERRTPEELGVVQGSDGFYYHPEDKYLKRIGRMKV